MYHSKPRAVTRISIISTFLFIFISSASSQWFRVNSGSSYKLGSIVFINDLTGFITGKNYGPFPNFQGEILKTNDGGNTWNRVLYDTTFRPNVIYFADQQTGFSAGGFYSTWMIILKTTNSGQSWLPYATDNTGSVSAISTFHNFGGDLFYAGGYNGRFLISTNSGLNWSVQSTFSFNPSEGAPIRSSFFLNTSTGWIVGDSNVVYKTTNAGLNWFGYQTIEQSHFYAIRMLDANTGFTAGTNGIIERTINSGTSWQLVSSGVTQRLTSMHFPAGAIGYIAGDNGTILKSTDAGLSWVSQNSGVNNSLYSVYFINALTGFAVGDTGMILKTTNGGVIGITPISNEIPKEFSLSQNYPNPFNPSTKFKIQIANSSEVKVTIYDALGTEVAVPVNRHLSPGTYEVEWYGAGYSSGVYFYRLIARASSLDGVFEQTRKMILNK